MAEGDTIEVLCGETDSYEDWVSELNHGVIELDDQEMDSGQRAALIKWAEGEDGYHFWVRYHYGQEVPA